MDLSNENVIHVKKNKIEYIQFRDLLKYKNIVTHAYSLGLDKNFRTSSEEEKNNSIENYKKLCGEIGVNFINIIKPNQKHTDCIKIANKKVNLSEPDINLEDYKDTDGIITNKSNLAISTSNADCILLLFFDPVKNVIANVHSGWRGTLQKISIKAVKKMEEEFKCEPKDIKCYICPSIRKCHFQVKSDVETLFKEEFKDLKDEELKQIIEEKEPGKTWNIDTVLINKIILEKEGLLPQNIIDSGICSVCNCDIIHSYRVEKENYGLNTAIIELK